MTGPRLLDLFCGSGGAAMGYHQAGFDVVGVDIEDHPDYPFEIIVDDAMAWLDADGFDVVHASPPCPRYSLGTPAARRNSHPDLLPPVLEGLKNRGGVWVVENVVGASALMPGAVRVCAWTLGRWQLCRHRLFCSSAPLVGTECGKVQGVRPYEVAGHADGPRGVPTQKHMKYRDAAHGRELLDTPWIVNTRDVVDAIPPAMTRFIGHQLRRRIFGVDA